MTGKSQQIEWTPDLQVGVKIIDDQHHSLVNMINNYEKDMIAGLGFKKIMILFREMVDYVRHHFKTEEALMIKHNFAGYGKHKIIHDSFTEHPALYIKRYQKGEKLVGIEVHRFLRDWLVNHILSHSAIADKKFAKFLNQKGIF